MFELRRARAVMQVGHAKCHEIVWQFRPTINMIKSAFACLEHFIAHAVSNSRIGMSCRLVKGAFCPKRSMPSRSVTMVPKNGNYFLKKSFRYPFQPDRLLFRSERSV